MIGRNSAHGTHSRADTRRALLDAAGDVIRSRGVNASLDDIARRAGVSKGGLLYHFASKDELILELVRSLLEAFRADIDSRLDPADTASGRLTRAYIRALLAPPEDEIAARKAIGLIGLLNAVIMTRVPEAYGAHEVAIHTI